MIEDREREDGKYNLQGNDKFDSNKLYALTFEQLSPLESSLLILARPESDQPREIKRAIISLVANSIALIDICNLFHELKVTNREARIESHDLEDANLDTRIESPVILGGEGGYDEPPPSVSGCLPHSISPQKIPNYFEIGKRIHTMLLSLSKIELSEEEWEASYELHVNNRKSKNPLSDRRVRF